MDFIIYLHFIMYYYYSFCFRVTSVKRNIKNEEFAKVQATCEPTNREQANYPCTISTSIIKGISIKKIITHP